MLNLVVDRILATTVKSPAYQIAQCLERRSWQLVRPWQRERRW